MKLCAIAAILMMLTPWSLNAQTYSVDGAATAGASGRSTNSQFSVIGTIGQVGAGGMQTNGQFSVLGGFWVLPEAVQTTGAPVLRITAAGPGQATVSWSPATPGFVLQVNDTLAPANWVNAPSAATNPTTVPATFPKKFYRLSKP